jgi:hypothetical protein
LPALVQLSQRGSIREKTALTMGDGQTQKRSLRATVGKWRIGDFNPRRHHLANKVERTIPNQGTGEQTDFAKNLKPVANADD